MPEICRTMLFDIRTDDSHAGFIAAVNRGLASEPDNPYLAQFGPVCSPHWWNCLDRGTLPIEVLSGEVSHSGPRIEECTGELEDVVEFMCEGQVIGYDRTDCWAVPFCIGDSVIVTRTIVNIDTRTGPMIYHIDLRAEWLSMPTEQDQAEPDPTLGRTS